LADNPDFMLDLGDTFGDDRQIDEISKEDLMTIAKANNIKKGEKIIEEINIVVKNWKEFANRAKVRKELLQTIQNNLHTLK